MKVFLPMYTLWLREVIRFLRQPNRVFGALGQPILFWVLVGSGFKASFRPMMFHLEIGYMEYFFPGIVLMVLLFTAIFSTFSIIEDRNEGFLQGVLVSPSPRLSIILGKVMGGATMAVIQALLFLILAPFLGFKFHVWMFLELILLLFLIAMSLTSFGFMLAWRMDSIQGFHALMMLILLPMWFLSGAFFPMEGVPFLMKWVMQLNPLMYGLSAVRRILYGSFTDVGELPSLEFSMGVTVLFGFVTILISWFLVSTKKPFLRKE